MGKREPLRYLPQKGTKKMGRWLREAGLSPKCLAQPPSSKDKHSSMIKVSRKPQQSKANDTAIKYQPEQVIMSQVNNVYFRKN